MKYRLTFLPLVGLLLSGCVDATGILHSCTSEMTQVRIENGPPQRSNRESSRGDYLEYWEYSDSRERYIFRWGLSYDGCQVERTSLNLIPAPNGYPQLD